MFKKLWQWLRNLVGIFSPRPEPARLEAIASPPDNSSPDNSVPSLGDRDYEFLFNQVLEGASHGWQAPRIKQFFEQTQDRITLEQWVNWLIEFGRQKLDTPKPDLELAQTLNIFARQTQNVPEIKEIGAASLALSQQLLQKAAKGEVWEYDGPDLAADAVIPQPSTAVFTLEELHEKLKEDANFRQAIAQQVGVNSDDPMVILQAVAYQISQQQEGS